MTDSVGEVGPNARLSRLHQGLFEGMRVGSQCFLFSCERDHSSNCRCAFASELSRFFVQLSDLLNVSVASGTSRKQKDRLGLLVGKDDNPETNKTS